MKKVVTFIFCIIACIAGVAAFVLNYVPGLSREQAMELLLKQDSVLYELYSQGFSENEVETAYEWYTNPDNIVTGEVTEFELLDSDGECYSVYCTEKFDTEEKFDTYFKEFVTEKALLKLKSQLNIKEINGKLCGVPLAYHTKNGYPEKAKILSVVKNGKTVFVTAEFVTYGKLYHPDVEEHLDSINDIKGNENVVDYTIEQCVYSFEYSIKYGWRSMYDTIGKACEVSSPKYAYNEYITTVSDKIAPVIRPSGYDDPELSYETALAILNDERLLKNQELSHAGFLAKPFVGSKLGVYDLYYKWLGCVDNQALPTYEKEHWHNNIFRIRFVPGLDTMKEFDDYFIQFFTEETLEMIKKEYAISESEGHLAIVPFGRLPIGSKLVDYELTTVNSIEYDDKTKTATVKLNEFDIEGNPCRLQYTSKLVYSENYGWRMHMEKISEFHT